MPQVIACPNCDKKLALRDEFKGRTLVCPQCQSRFLAPSETGPSDERPANLFGASSAEVPSRDGSGVDFLDNLAPVPGPAAARTATKNPAGSAASARPTATRPSASAAAGRAKTKTDPTLLYVGGGIAAAVLIVVALIAVFNSGDASRSGGKKKHENIRFNMTEAQRRQLYEDLIHAVDLNGISKATQKEWRSLGKEFKLTDQQIVDVLEEGLANNDWEQPAMTATMDQKQKTNRREWFRARKPNQEPIMAQ